MPGTEMHPEDLVPYIVVVAALVLLVVYLRARELFCVSVRGGRTLVVRGRIPPGLLTSIGEVVRRDGVKRGTVKALRGEHNARLVTSGMSEATEQRLRNVFGIHPVQKLRSAPPIRAKNLGQVLGIAWLAWMFLGSRRSH